MECCVPEENGIAGESGTWYFDYKLEFLEFSFKFH